MRLKDGLTFKDHSQQLSEAIGTIGDMREEGGRQLITVLYREFSVMAEDVPAENFDEIVLS